MKVEERGRVRDHFVIFKENERLEANIILVPN